MKLVCTGLVLAMILPLAGLLSSPASAMSLPPLPRSSAAFNDRVEAMVVKGSTIYVVGDFTAATDSRGTHPRDHVAAIDATTGRLLPWKTSTNGVVLAVTYFKNQIFIGGDFTRAGGVAVSGVARVSASSGKVSPTFRPMANGAVRALAASRHRLYLGGDFYQVSGVFRPHLAAVDRNTGAVDATWNPRADRPVRVLRLHRRLLYAGGDFSTIGGDPTHAHLVALQTNAGGAAAASFHPHLHYPVLGVTFVKTRVVVAAGGSGGKLLVLRGSGTKVWRRTFDGDVNAVAVVGGRIYAGGHWQYICSTRRVTPRMGNCLDAKIYVPKLASYTLQGKRIHWSPEPDSWAGVLTMATAGKQLAVGGDFNHFLHGPGQVTQRKFALFDGQLG